MFGCHTDGVDREQSSEVSDVSSPASVSEPATLPLVLFKREAARGRRGRRILPGVGLLGVPLRALTPTQAGPERVCVLSFQGQLSCHVL